MEQKKIFVLGAGVMGRGIAQVAAQSGFQVYLSDVNISIVENSIAMVKSQLDKRVQKGKMEAEEAAAILARITPCEDLTLCGEADLIIEAVVEDVKIKQSVFEKLEEAASPTAILASNTTSCSITEIASATKNPERVIGMHFFNPAVVMPLVEIMPGLLTAGATVEETKKYAAAMKKDPVVTNREGPAGVASRILAGLLNEAVWVLHEGIATVDAIDKAMVLGCNHKMGPFALMDLIGIDVHLAKTKMLYAKTGDARYRPCFLLEQMVAAGILGKKAGKGFYDYSQDPPTPLQVIRTQG
ncbi:MAG: 3-hydroxyacyl-CoA dehydrogenase family protein [bacterium]|jgi:3-hydroxybutyryl-CoA dehydrogenase